MPTVSITCGMNKEKQIEDKQELIQVHFKTSGEAIEQKISVNYLRVILDNEMKKKDHITLVSSKVSTNQFIEDAKFGASRDSF